MLKKNEGIDIVKEIGGVQNVEQAQALFKKRLDEDHLSRIQTLSHPEILIKIANAIAMCDPARVYINTGSEADRQFIRQLALNKGEEAILPMEGHTIHYDLKEEQGRIIDRTFYIANPGEKISSLANKILRDDALVDVREKMGGIMSGATMVVGLYIRGPVGAAASNPRLKSPVLHTSPTVPKYSIATLFRISKKRSVGWGIFTPISTVRASTGPRICPMHGFSWTGATAPPIPSTALTRATPCC
jgi:hypothetical protein